MSNIIFLLLQLITICIICDNQENIIIIPYHPMRRPENISTKYGQIPMQISFYDDGYFYINNIKNLNLFSFPDYNCTYELYGDKNDSLKITIKQDSLGKYNALITKLFYETKYIDKMIYAIGYNGKYRINLGKTEFYSSLFFGGVPKYISKNLIKYSFFPNDTVSEINILYKNGTKINIQTDSEKKENNLIGFGGYYICFPEYILVQIKKLLLKDFPIEDIKGFTPEYLSNSEKFKTFPNIAFKIGDKIINISKYELSPDRFSFYFKLLIDYNPCNHFIFGQNPFLGNVDMREYNLETNEINFYVRKNKSIIIGAKEMKINSYKFNYLILIFITITFINIFIFWRKKTRIKKSEEFNKYFII